MALKKPAPVAPKTVATAAAVTFFDFFNPANYSGGGSVLPAGRYAMYHEFMADNPERKGKPGQAHQPWLGVMLTAYDLGNPSAEPKKQFLSMGQKAHLSFMPDETGKRLVAVPGGPAPDLNNKTNWSFYLKSMQDSLLPPGLSADLTVIDGIHVRTSTMDEPSDRASFGQGTKNAMNEDEETEAAGPAKPRELKKIPIVIEILQTGMPWAGTGGVPDAPIPDGEGAGGPAPLTPKGAAPAAPAAAEEAATELPDGVTMEDLAEAVEGAFVKILAKNKTGLAMAAARVSVHEELTKEKYEEESITLCIDHCVDNKANLAIILSKLGYKVAFNKIVVG